MVLKHFNENPVSVIMRLRFASAMKFVPYKSLKWFWTIAVGNQRYLWVCCFPKPQIIALMVYLLPVLRTLYNRNMTNCSISLAIYEWILRERATDECGRQTHAFLLSRCYRPHWVRSFLAGGGPGCCLVKLVLGNLVVVCSFSSFIGVAQVASLCYT